ncbi:MAG: hypothetical protein EA412_12420 [Chitinophagaceae bacterium]|nr:MAG: hypothetical protein EA412_12420 [Chitinophagaceae bacterium]
MKQYKISWYFHGQVALQTAEHYEKHLYQFAKRNNIIINESKIETLNEFSVELFILCNEPGHQAFINSLKPAKFTETKS